MATYNLTSMSNVYYNNTLLDRVFFNNTLVWVRLQSVSISGTVKEGETLTAITVPTDAPITSYQWYRGSSAIGGATSKTYKLVAADAGYSISVRAYVDTFFKTSSGTSSVIPLLNSVSISGTATVSSTLTAVTNPTTISGVTYQWYRGNAAISGANAKTYTLVQADRGSTIKVSATVSGVTKTSSATAAVVGWYTYSSNMYTMTSNTTPSPYKVTESISGWLGSSGLAYYVFDNNTSTTRYFYQSIKGTAASYTATIMFNLSYSVRLEQIQLRLQSTAAAVPTVVQYTTNGSTWTTIGTYYQYASATTLTLNGSWANATGLRVSVSSSGVETPAVNLYGLQVTKYSLWQ